MRAATLTLAGLLAISAALPAMARPVWTSGTFVYADLCTDQNAGRLEGRRVTVRRSPNGDGVLYEAAAGAAVTPVPAEVLSIDDGTRQIAFTVESEAGPMHFQGVAGADVLAGTLSDGSGDRPLRLRRVLRSHEREACQAMQQDPDTTASTN
ncbi:hypothetical protein [Methylobacterium haplocladii]|uniref:Uncharacterized protein n=1 Tax=Methylobacterium haplocladii TaxID=1176176 RepID=A0A512ITM6_9HYPH|nr:hypothetical protein [Methylobacterium haplocladii]GEP01054.1 hypothetical protein MHA02_34410 [Methylobacterium haplocladii]GJD85641.1 hypothetical protein HPGCJGGD_3531 [Methylobacterium haplocladii]GLS60508.1 hypothetical protein GCM10007887_31870 [Methylobacterium haplocladii]